MSSGAFFGVVGRVIGSVQNLFIGIGFFALAIWTGGQAAVAGMHRLWNIPEGNGALVLAFVGVSIVCVLVATYGHANIVGVQRLVLPSMGILIIMGYIVFAPNFNAHFHHGPYILGLLLGHMAARRGDCGISADFVRSLRQRLCTLHLPPSLELEEDRLRCRWQHVCRVCLGIAFCHIHRHRDACERLFLGERLDPTQSDLVRRADRIDRHRRQFCPRRCLYLRQRT